jgi:hypothetical protein
MADHYFFRKGVMLSVSGDPKALRHFRREYGQVATDDGGPASVEAFFGPFDDDGSSIRGGHKTMRWQVAMSNPSAQPLTLRVQISGVPTGYALSMVQGYFIEPMLSVAAMRAGAVLLPAASFVVDGKATMVAGLSGSGKTSLSAHALALHQPLLGDDQVLVTADGRCGPFPRSLRLYPDIRDRSPLAYAGLPGLDRAKLEIRRAARTLTAGWLTPSLALSGAAFGQATLPDAVPLGHIVLLSRSPLPGRVQVEQATTGEAIEFGLAALREQRSKLADGREAWRQALAGLERQEARLLGRAFACVSVSRVVAPTPLDGNGVARLAEQLGLRPRGPAQEAAS